LGTVPETEKIHADLSGAPQTMLATLYGRALDADTAKPILGDAYAKELVSRGWTMTGARPASGPGKLPR
jgi:O-methyltransferase involved in polyketide biosynthesis